MKAIVRAFNKEMDGPSPGTASLTFYLNMSPCLRAAVSTSAMMMAGRL